MAEYLIKVQVEFTFVVDEADEAHAEEQAWNWEKFPNRKEEVTSTEVIELVELEEGEEWDPEIESLRP